MKRSCYEPDIDDVDQFDVKFNVVYIIKWYIIEKKGKRLLC